ncbi:helix-turn-helix domain-containing protein [Deinococcus sp.]|uniref:helix-turn-helix domain-containing protein n=1 Tax=Deinococcus sp. TaxID=47478 RepID=UPI003B5B99A5
MTSSRVLFHLWADLDSVAHDLLAPIADEPQLTNVLRAIDELMLEIGEDQVSPLLSLLNLLVDRVEAFESQRYATSAASPERVLAFLLEQHDLTQQQLEAATGIHQSNISKLLKGTRRFSVGQASKLGAYFGVNPAVFLTFPGSA